MTEEQLCSQRERQIQIWRQVSDQVCNRGYSCGYEQIRDKVSDEVWVHVLVQVRDWFKFHVNEQMYNQVYAKVLEQIRDPR